MRNNQLTRHDFAKPRMKPWRVKNPGGNLGLGYDNTDFLYDSISVAQAAAMPNLTPMFQVPSSGAKTKAQTNMKIGGMLANGASTSWCCIRRWGCAFHSLWMWSCDG